MNEKKEKIRQDINLSKYQIFTTSKTKNKENRIINTKRGTIEICYLGNYGFLQVLDYKVLLALTKLWMRSGKKNTVSFSIYELLNILNLDGKGGKNYTSIGDSLTRLANVPIIWTRSYFDKATNKDYKVIKSYRILEDLIIKTKEGKEKESSFKFNKYLLRNLKNNYTKPVYLDTILSLKSEIAILMFRYIDYVLFKHKVHGITLINLIKELGLSEYSYKSDRLRIIQKGINELQAIKLTSGDILNIRLEETRDKKDYNCFFSKLEVEKKIEEKANEYLTQKQAQELKEIFNKKTLKGRVSEDNLIQIAENYKADYEKLKDIITRVKFTEKYEPIQTVIAVLTKKYVLPEKNSNTNEFEKKENEKTKKRNEKFEQEKKEDEELELLFRSLSAEKQEELIEKALEQLKQENPNFTEKKVGNSMVLFHRAKALLKAEQVMV
jgi:hypothetical protein